MSGQHTQGRLVAYGLVIRGDENTSEDQVASATYSTEDARRLAACWNACEHLSTEALEELGPMAAALCSGDQQAIAERDQLRAERDAARALLQEALDEFDADAASIRAEGDFVVPHPRVARIRELLGDAP